MKRVYILLAITVYLSCSEKANYNYTDFDSGDAIESFYLNERIVLEKHYLYKLSDADPLLKLYGGNKVVYVIGKGGFSKNQLPHLRIKYELVTNVQEINFSSDFIYGAGYKVNEIVGNFKLLTDIYGKNQKVWFLIDNKSNCQYFNSIDELKYDLELNELKLNRVDQIIDDLRNKREKFKRCLARQAKE